MDLFKCYRYFLVVSDAKSFSKAALILNTGQSSISKHISYLEYYFGEQLFLRNKSGVSLTRLGQTVYPDIVRSVQLNKIIKHKITSNSHGNLTIYFSVDLPSYLCALIFNLLKSHFNHKNIMITRSLTDSIDLFFSTMLHSFKRDYLSEKICNLHVGFYSEKHETSNNNLMQGKLLYLHPSLRHHLSAYQDVSNSMLVNDYDFIHSMLKKKGVVGSLLMLPFDRTFEQLVQLKSIPLYMGVQNGILSDELHKKIIQSFVAREDSVQEQSTSEG